MPIPYTPRVSAANAIELNEVSKLYGTFAALRRVTVEFHSGKSYVILGPNGAGKSTLLRNLAGLTRPTFGKMTILGSGDVSAVRSRIGYLGHDSMLYDELTAMENLRYSASLYQRRNTSHGTMDPRRIAHHGRPRSGPGPTRREVFAGYASTRFAGTGVDGEAGLLLLDEPFSNVDIASSTQMLHVLDQLRPPETRFC